MKMQSIIHQSRISIQVLALKVFSIDLNLVCIEQPSKDNKGNDLSFSLIVNGEEQPVTSIGETPSNAPTKKKNKKTKQILFATGLGGQAKLWNLILSKK